MPHRDSFVHLHLHSDYSLLDGACRIDGIIEAAKKHGMSAVALTDHGNMFGAIEFYRKALKAGIKPIVGIEAYVAPGNRTQKDQRGPHEAAHHLTLLVRNETGYKNLLKLSSIAYQEGMYYKPRMDKEILAKYSDGLLAMSGCLASELSRAITADRIADAEAAAGQYRDIFGKGHFFIEVMSHGRDDERAVGREAVALAKRLDLPIVGTNDVHYLQKDDATAHDALLCISTGRLVSDVERMRYEPREFHFKSTEEMKAAFRDLPEAVANTLRVAEQCALDLDFKEKHLPRFTPPDGLDAPVYLQRLCEEGLKARYSHVTPEIRERLKYELEVIGKMGFPSYFLIVWDFIRYAKEKGIPVGPGRGSAAGSLVSYCLGITDLDPLKYDLLFERFLNPGRYELPDIDIDFCQDRRGEVIEYVRRKYGEANVSQIVTFGTMAARLVVRDVGRVLGIPLGEVDALAKKIPAELHITLKKALESEPELRKMHDSQPRIKELFDISMRLEGLRRHASTHAAGVVIADRPLTDYVPLYVNDGEVTTQYPMDILGEIGLLKMDFLGLSTLTILDRACGVIRKTRGKTIDLRALPLDQRETYAMLGRGETRGVFQLESQGMTDLVQKMKPDKFEDLIALIALFRPGVLKSGMVDTYIKCKHGFDEPQYLHPMMKPILEPTNGVILYQEQVMRIANVVGGLSLADADSLRKAMGKKKPEIIARYRTQFVEGAKKNGVDEQVATRIFDLMEYFAGYGFNKCVVGETTLVEARTGERTTVAGLFRRRRPFRVHSLGEDGKLRARPVKQVVCNGRKPVFRLRTTQGKEVTATGNHPFKTLNGWTRLSDLRPGDRIAAPRRLPTTTARRWPEHELITLAGLISEGNTCHPTCLYFFGKDRILVEDFARAAEQFPDTRARITSRREGMLEVCVSTGRDARFRPGDHPWNWRGVAGGSATEAGLLPTRSGAFVWASELGVVGRKAAAKRVPEAVFTLRDADVELFLGRLWAGDGFFANATQATPFYATSSEGLARDVQTLLLRVGILSGIHRKTFKYRGGTRTGFTVHLIGEGSTETFLARVAPHAPGRESQVRLLKRHIDDTDRDHSSKDTLPAEIRDWVDIERRSRPMTWRQLEAESDVSMREFVGRGSAGKRGFRRSTIARLAAFFPSRRLAEAAQSDVFWDRVAEVTPLGTRETFDLTVEEDHNFVADGLIVHNSHSTAYALISYQTAWLKANYTVEYMAALMTCERDNTDKIVDYIEECHRLKIEVLPPDVNESEVDFTVVGDKIRFGLGAVKMVGDKAVESMLKARARVKRFTSIHQFCEEVDLRAVDKQVIESLNRAGAFDSLGARRSQIAATIEQAMELGNAHQHDRLVGQQTFFDGGGAGAFAGKHPPLPDLPEWGEGELLANEKQSLGFYVTDNPLTRHAEVLRCYATHTTKLLAGVADNSDVRLGGIVSSTRSTVIKQGASAGKRMSIIRFKDLEGSCDAVLFPEEREKFGPYLREDAIVFIRGRVTQKREEPSVWIADVLPIERARESLTAHVTVRVPLAGLDEAVVEAIQTVFAAHPGPAPVFLRVIGDDGEEVAIRVANSFFVSASEAFVADVERVLGAGCLTFTSKPLPPREEPKWKRRTREAQA